ncbi:unnamed protein product, partial [Protopolystoma xenopodis]
MSFSWELRDAPTAGSLIGFSELASGEIQVHQSQESETTVSSRLVLQNVRKPKLDKMTQADQMVYVRCRVRLGQQQYRSVYLPVRVLSPSSEELAEAGTRYPGYWSNDTSLRAVIMEVSEENPTLEVKVGGSLQLTCMAVDVQGKPAMDGDLTYGWLFTGPDGDTSVEPPASSYSML